MVSLVVGLLGFVITLLTIGLVASFSPLLYATQLAILVRKKDVIRQSIALVAGILLGLTLLGMLFFIIQPETLHAFSLVGFLDRIWSRWLDGIFGIIFVAAGAYFLLSHPKDKKKKNTTNVPRRTSGSIVALFSLGLTRSVTRAVGAAALLLGVRLILGADEKLSFLWILSLIIILLGAMIPFLFLFVVSVRAPRLLTSIQHRVSKLTPRVLYRLAGISFMTIGAIFLVLVLFGLLSSLV